MPKADKRMTTGVIPLDHIRAFIITDKADIKPIALVNPKYVFSMEPWHYQGRTCYCIFANCTGDLMWQIPILDFHPWFLVESVLLQSYLQLDGENQLYCILEGEKITTTKFKQIFLHDSYLFILVRNLNLLNTRRVVVSILCPLSILKYFEPQSACMKQWDCPTAQTTPLSDHCTHMPLYVINHTP